MYYAFRWLTSPFGEYPNRLCFRLFDIFLLEGTKIFFCLGLYILKTNEKKFYDMNSDQILLFLQSAPQSLDSEDEVIDNVLKLDFPLTLLEKCSVDYDEMLENKRLKEKDSFSSCLPCPATSETLNEDLRPRRRSSSKKKFPTNITFSPCINV